MFHNVLLTLQSREIGHFFDLGPTVRSIHEVYQIKNRERSRKGKQPMSSIEIDKLGYCKPGAVDGSFPDSDPFLRYCHFELLKGTLSIQLSCALPSGQIRRSILLSVLPELDF